MVVQRSQTLFISLSLPAWSTEIGSLSSLITMPATDALLPSITYLSVVFESVILNFWFFIHTPAFVRIPGGIRLALITWTVREVINGSTVGRCDVTGQRHMIKGIRTALRRRTFVDKKRFVKNLVAIATSRFMSTGSLVSAFLSDMLTVPLSLMSLHLMQTTFLLYENNIIFHHKFF